MKTILAIVPVLFLTACLSAPVKRNFPEVPQELLTACPSLEQVDPATTHLSEVVWVVTENYAQYHECRVKVETWIEWYKTQRSIFEEVK